MTKNIKLLGLFNFFSNINFTVPILLVFFLHKTGSFTLASSIVSIVLISSAFFEIPTGILSDFIGRKKTIILGSISMIIALILFGISSNYWILVIGAIISGLSKSFYSGNNEAFLYNNLQEEGVEEQYHHFAGKLEAFIGISAIVAAFSSGFIANISYSLLIWLSLIPQFAGLLIVFMMSDIKTKKSGNIYRHFKEAIQEFKSNVNLRLLSLAKILGSATGPTNFEFQAALFSIYWPTWAIGIARSLQEIVAIAPVYFSGKIIDRIGKTKAIFLSSSYSWLMNLLAVLSQSFISPIFIILSPILWGPGEFASESLLQKEFTDKQRATMASLNSLVGSLLFAVFLFAMGNIADKIGPIITILIILVFQLPGILLDWKIFKRIG